VNGNRWLRRLARYCWRYQRFVVLALAGAFISAFATAAIPLIQRLIIDDIVATHRQSMWTLATVLLVLAAMNFGGLFMRRYFGNKMALNVQHDLRVGLLSSLARLDGVRQDEMQTGQLVSRSITDLNMAQTLLSMVPITLGSILSFLVTTGIMLALSPLLTLVAATVGPSLWFIALKSRMRLYPASWHVSQQSAEVAAIVGQNIGGVRVVKGFGQELREQERLEQASRSLYGSRLRMIRLIARYNPALTVIPNLGLVGVLALGGWLAIRGQLTLGTFLAFSAYLAQLTGPVRILTTLVTTGQEARASVIRVFEVIDVRPLITDRPEAADLPPDANGITFDNVYFRYRGGPEVLTGLTLRVAAGEIVALVGASGSGKTTIANLLPRFYEPTSGRVTLGDHDIRDLTSRSVRAAIGLVPEESFLFSDTVRANIAFGQPHATDEQVVAAAKAALAHELIVRLPDGYDTVIGEQGLSLSGGQRQRLALARALLINPRVLVLDDATSAIDPRLETEIHASLHTIMRGHTMLIIAHRRSTLSMADRIVVLDEGRVLDSGTHEELTARCSRYRQLITSPGDDEIEDLVPAGHDPGDQAARPARMSRGQPGQGPTGGSLSSMPPTPDLLAAVNALPAVKDTPRVDVAQARAEERDFSLGRLLKPLASALLVGLLLDALFATATLALPALVREGIDRGIEHRDFGTVMVTAAIGLAIVAGSWIVYATETMVVGRNGERLLYTLRVKLFAQMQRLGLDFYEKELSGRIITRMTTDVDALATFLQTGLITVVSALLTFFGVLAALLIINTELGLTVLVIVPVLVAAALVFRAKSAKAYAQARREVAVVNADFVENVAGLRITQGFARESTRLARFTALSDAYRQTRIRIQAYIGLFFPFVQTLSTVAGAIVLVIATAKVQNGTLSAGGLIAYLLYIDMVFSPVQDLSQSFDGYQQASVGLNRVTDLLRLGTSTPSPASTGILLPRGRIDGRVEFRNVFFEYANSDRNALCGVNLVVEPGETVALVGQTGAGKSTIVKLIARFYDPTAGAVLVDGVDLREFDLTTYRHQIGLVPQEPYLFTGTVREAIAYARPCATDAEVANAARAVGAHQAILSLPGGYAHEISERGRNLSSGQRQLIALARAQLADPAILLLDEATAALDLASEATVNRAIGTLTAARTTIIVAHRLTTAARADRIVVMDNGLIAERGTHDELIALGGTYAALWAAFAGR
jgi:ATP-binding cassette, subfamily B, bacterial